MEEKASAPSAAHDYGRMTPLLVFVITTKFVIIECHAGCWMQNVFHEYIYSIFSNDELDESPFSHYYAFERNFFTTNRIHLHKICKLISLSFLTLFLSFVDMALFSGHNNPLCAPTFFVFFQLTLQFCWNKDGQAS